MDKILEEMAHLKSRNSYLTARNQELEAENERLRQQLQTDTEKR